MFLIFLYIFKNKVWPLQTSGTPEQSQLQPGDDERGLAVGRGRRGLCTGGRHRSPLWEASRHYWGRLALSQVQTQQYFIRPSLLHYFRCDQTTTAHLNFSVNPPPVQTFSLISPLCDAVLVIVTLSQCASLKPDTTVEAAGNIEATQFFVIECLTND